MTSETRRGLNCYFVTRSKRKAPTPGICCVLDCPASGCDLDRWQGTRQGEWTKWAKCKYKEKKTKTNLLVLVRGEMCLLLLFPLIYHANGVLELVQIHRRRSCCTNSCQKQQWISQSRANTQLVTVEQHRVCEGISIISLSFLSKCGLWIIPVLSFIRGFFFFFIDKHYWCLEE